MKKIYTYGRQSISWKDAWVVAKTLLSPLITQGPKASEFERAICDYTGAKYCVVVANGTAALHLAMLALGVDKGDEVITSPITFVASANCALYVGGVAKFADIERETANIDPEEIKKQITPKTKVIIPVHFSGQSCNMEKIAQIAKENNLFVVEDAAQALGSEYKQSKVGSCKYSDLTTFSFHPVKNITMGEGGAITTNSEELYNKLLLLRTHGITKDPRLLIRNDGPWSYEQHLLGFNYRITDFQCALGVSQLKRLDKFASKRRKIFDIYKKLFANDERFSLLKEIDDSNAVWHLCPLLIDFSKVIISKTKLFEVLSKDGVNLQVHHIPVHTQPYYEKLGFKCGDYPVSEEYYKQAVSLPIYFDLTKSDVNCIVQKIKALVK